MSKSTFINRLTLLTLLLLSVALLPTSSYVQAAPILGGGVVISEIRIDMPGTDNDEFFELSGAPNQALDGLTYVVIGDGTGGSGVLEEVIDLTGQTMPASGYFVAAEDTFSLGTADLTTNLNFENGDNVTHLLVTGFTGAENDDLDTDDDGVLDATPWTGVQNKIALVEEENPPSGTEYHYGPPSIGPDGSFVPGHVFDCPDGWQIGPFDPAGGKDTPGAANACPSDPGEFGNCGDPATFIHAIQGSGTESPEQGNSHTIEGIVVGDFQASDELEGFFLQEEFTNWDSDTDDATSEGIFVYDDGFGVDVNVGDVVRVRGEVAEYYGLTQLQDVTNVAVCAWGSAPPPIIDLPIADPAIWEHSEGMLIFIPQTLYVTEHYNQGRYGEVELSVNGRLYQPTHLVEPGAPARAQQATNDRSRIQLDDGSTWQNPDPVPYMAADNTLRAGDTIADLTGVLGYAFSKYEVHPVGTVPFTRANARDATPPGVGGTLKVASFNVLNYFTTIDTGADICGPSGNMECRGADSAAEFTRQRDKIISALAGMDADIVGLVEIENNATTAIQDLINGLNAEMGAGTYAFIDTGTTGTDAIKVAFIYKPSTVTPVGSHATLDSSVDPDFIDTKNRPTLAQTFEEKASGEALTVAVNHLKSKGSSCASIGDPDLNDGQGNCNLTRTKAAQALADWLATDPTSSGDPDFLIIGDLNAYAREDPITALKNAGYTDLIASRVGADAYSYVFEGQFGYLDHALACRCMAEQVTGVVPWHINADEPRALDYNDYNQPELYSPDAYRSSDHDPVIVGLRLGEWIKAYLPIVVRE